ncbi:MAG: hypothetical protein BGO67_04805 [Alphaproteobacteria bacterium 41-28]|nr:MAG: hypothetical protein BGO67_04805 [Alphaproteobacteria bacterium 41-28]
MRKLQGSPYLWAQRGYEGGGQLNPLETKHKLSDGFSNVGYATASFHIKHGSLDEETGTFNSITNGDLHISNMFYNILSNKTTFIDYETMVYSKEMDDLKYPSPAASQRPLPQGER